MSDHLLYTDPWPLSSGLNRALSLQRAQLYALRGAAAKRSGLRGDRVARLVKIDSGNSSLLRAAVRKDTGRASMYTSVNIINFTS